MPRCLAGLVSDDWNKFRPKRRLVKVRPCESRFSPLRRVRIPFETDRVSLNSDAAELASDRAGYCGATKTNSTRGASAGAPRTGCTAAGRRLPVS